MTFIKHYTQKFVLHSLLGQTFQRNTTLYENKHILFLPFILKYRPVYMTAATLNANNNVDIRSISSKFNSWIGDRIKNLYTQNQWSMHLSCVCEAVYNRTFWRTLVCISFSAGSRSVRLTLHRSFLFLKGTHIRYVNSRYRIFIIFFFKIECKIYHPFWITIENE